MMINHGILDWALHMDLLAQENNGKHPPMGSLRL
jgi:hypothetical protein